MPRRGTKSSQSEPLQSADLQAFERLVDRGAVIAVPAQRNAKPRKVVAAAIADGGRGLLLYLAKETTTV
jgi:hypothetical protein